MQHALSRMIQYITSFLRKTKELSVGPERSFRVLRDPDKMFRRWINAEQKM